MLRNQIPYTKKISSESNHSKEKLLWRRFERLLGELFSLMLNSRGELVLNKKEARHQKSTWRSQSKPPTAIPGPWWNWNVLSLITSMTGVTTVVELRAIRSKRGSSHPVSLVFRLEGLGQVNVELKVSSTVHQLAPVRKTACLIIPETLEESQKNSSDDSIQFFWSSSEFNWLGINAFDINTASVNSTTASNSSTYNYSTVSMNTPIVSWNTTE